MKGVIVRTRGPGNDCHAAWQCHVTKAVRSYPLVAMVSLLFWDSAMDAHVYCKSSCHYCSPIEHLELSVFR